MDINKISTEKDLLTYLDRHPTVKSSLIGTLVDKCMELFETDYEIASIVYRHSFFRKKEKVLKHCAKKNYQGIISEMINIGVQNLDIEILSEIDKWFIEREDEVLEKIFSNKLRASRLFDCLMYFDKTSKIFAKAIEEIENIELSENELIVLINSINQGIYRISSIKLIFLKDEFGSEIISNSVYDVHKSKAELEHLRIKLLERALKRLRNSWKLILILEFIFEEDLEKLKNVLDISIIEWFHLEQKITDQIPFSEPTFIDFFGIEEYYPEMHFPDIWERFETANNPFQLFIIFELLKLKIILTEKEILINELNFKKLLSNTLTAYYIKKLHKLGILTKVPKMSEVFEWPNISLTDVKLYLNRFEGQFNDESPLKKLGYQVGKNSKLKTQERQDILRKAFKSVSADDLEPYSWGAKNSPTRLESIARHIANQIEKFRRIKTRNYFYAIQDWKDDLGYLKSEFYDEKYADAFIWVKI